MKAFLFKLLYLIPIPLIMIGINLYIDPANLFNEKYEEGIANYLAQGHNVTNGINYNERLLQKHYISKMPNCPEVIALGSSRIMQINSKNLGITQFINNGVSGATLEDDLAIYYLYEKKGCKIKKIIFGIDPWLLNDNNYQFRWMDLAEEYGLMANKIRQNSSVKPKSKSQNNLTKYKELLSFSYFKTSLNYMVRGVNKRYSPTDKIVNKGFTRLVDGSIYYDEHHRNTSVEMVDKQANQDIAKDPLYALGDFSKFSEKNKNLFLGFMDYLQNQGIEVELFFSPFHPIIYDFIKSEKYYHIVLETEEYFIDFAKKHQIKVYGSFDPAKCHIDKSSFFDSGHCDEEAISSLINQK